VPAIARKPLPGFSDRRNIVQPTRGPTIASIAAGRASNSYRQAAAPSADYLVLYAN
jgi:hypothetical protein